METGAALSRRPTVVGGLLLILMLLTGLGWAVSSPVESSPDDNYHLGSIWCPRPAGESCQTSVVDGDPVVRVPIAVADESMRCYVLQSNKSAGCALGYNDSHMVWSKRFDNGAYPIGYYHFHHLLVGKDVQTSVLVMRGVNVLIAVTLLGTIGFCAPRQLRRPFIGAIVGLVVPWGLLHRFQQSQLVGRLRVDGILRGNIDGPAAERASSYCPRDLRGDRRRDVLDVAI